MNPRYKLTDLQVLEIMKLYALGWSTNALAREYEVSRTAIAYRVKHLTPMSREQLLYSGQVELNLDYNSMRCAA